MRWGRGGQAHERTLGLMHPESRCFFSFARESAGGRERPSLCFAGLVSMRWRHGILLWDSIGFALACRVCPLCMGAWAWVIAGLLLRPEGRGHWRGGLSACCGVCVCCSCLRRVAYTCTCSCLVLRSFCSFFCVVPADLFSMLT
jgi:hypothetical protein